MKKASKNQVSGFTLIELLVVVLIIGILSALALPQYQKTVLKSRTTEAWANLSALHTAAKLYCLENPDSSGELSLSDLSIEVQNTKHFGYMVFAYCDLNNRISVSANYLGKEKFTLGFALQEGRLCKGGKVCKDLGFSSYTNMGNMCHCGAQSGETGNGCYYAQ